MIRLTKRLLDFSLNQAAFEEHTLLILIGKNYAEVPELKHCVSNEPRYLCQTPAQLLLPWWPFTRGSFRQRITLDKSCCRRWHVVHNLYQRQIFQMDWRCMLKGPDKCFKGYKYIHIPIDKFLSKEAQIFSYIWFQWCLGDTLECFWKLLRGRYTSMGLNPVENLPDRVKFSSSHTSCLKVKCLP